MATITRNYQLHGVDLNRFSDLPAPGTKWKHKSGNEYRVIVIANEHAEKPESYPLTVVYEGEDGRIWSRLASDWHRSFEQSEGRASNGR